MPPGCGKVPVSQNEKKFAGNFAIRRGVILLQFLFPTHGGVAERLIAPVLKTGVRDERTGGSNPSSSATHLFYLLPSKSKILVNFEMPGI